MPNWVFNGLTIEGNPEQVKSLIKQMNKPFVYSVQSNGDLSFDIKQRKYVNPIFAFHNIYSYVDHGVSDTEYHGQSKLSAQYPTLLFTLSYEEETGWGGEMEFLRGEVISESEYDNMCRDCDATNQMEYCEEDCGEICGNCNWLGEADLEAVAKCQTHKIYLDTKVPEYRKAEAK